MEGSSKVRAISECFIKPKNVAGKSKKPFYLGSFELRQMCHYYIQTGLLFDRFPKEYDGNMSFFLGKLAQALSSTLDQFYPLAGQLVTQVDEEDKHESFIFVDYNKGPGAKFIHAILDGVTVNDIISPTYVPTNMVQSFFELGRITTNYNGHDEPLLVIQVTELIDGVFLGISANHAIIDGTTLWNFLLSWSEIFQSNDTKISRPPLCKPWFPEGHGPIIKIPNVLLDEFRTRHNMDSTNSAIREVIFHLSHESITKLKAKANTDCAVANKISSFQALSAFIWRSITRARHNGLGSDEDSICFIMANARSKLEPPLSQNYFGSPILPSILHIKVSSLLEDSLGRIALALRDAVRELTDQHLRDKFLKWMKSPSFLKIDLTSSSFIVIGGVPREDQYNVEFGLGKPVAIRSGSNKIDGKVTLRPGKEGTGSVSLEICLSPDAMLSLQQDQEFVSFLS